MNQLVQRGSRLRHARQCWRYYDQSFGLGNRALQTSDHEPLPALNPRADARVRRDKPQSFAADLRPGLARIPI